MERWLERWIPTILTVAFAINFHFLIMPAYSGNILKNFNSILSMSSTLASVLFGFVGVIIGVVVSINHSYLMIHIKRANAYSLLKEYIWGSFIGCVLTLICSASYIFIIPDDLSTIPWMYIEILASLLCWVITTSIRMIVILFELAELNRTKNNKNNLWNNDAYSPDRV